MMQSMLELEHSLSIALLRLDELICFDSAAIFLRDGDGDELRLLQTMGLPPERIGVSSISPGERTLGQREANTIIWGWGSGRSKLPYSQIDRTAAAGMAVRLYTLDNFIGLLFVGTRRPQGFTEQAACPLGAVRPAYHLPDSAVAASSNGKHRPSNRAWQPASVLAAPSQ